MAENHQALTKGTPNRCWAGDSRSRSRSSSADYTNPRDIQPRPSGDILNLLEFILPVVAGRTGRGIPRRALSRINRASPGDRTDLSRLGAVMLSEPAPPPDVGASNWLLRCHVTAN
ncbi:hypothetical protein RRG08_011119 [Elysia crispata]|uniref:Uncharacterized protein n=1 Tax=Elysia crispata TaxID=231223 RepID=A0AAE1A0F5_9GAST|nr:hypothetical protein RRG08_011119 [Elysia crispata]